MEGIAAVILWSALVLVCGPAWADTCTLLVDAATGRVIKREGPCDARSSPASTFKVPLSLMGYDAGLLTSEDAPAWPYRPEYKAWNDAWKKTITPRPWLRDSVVWYSQALTRTMGAKRFKDYVGAFEYGNRDLSGDPGKANGLTNAWLSSSLQISPVEQVAFLRRLLKRELPVSAQARDMTMAIMPAFASEGWAVRGKTGSGFQRGQDGKPDRSRQFGWFVGWAERGNRTVVLARLIRDERKESSVASFRARDSLLADLPALLRD
jgi:beta-lactamase class D